MSTELVGVTTPAPLKPRLQRKSASQRKRGLSCNGSRLEPTKTVISPDSALDASCKLDGASTAKCTLQTTSIGLTVAATKKYSGLVLLKIVLRVETADWPRGGPGVKALNQTY